MRADYSAAFSLVFSKFGGTHLTNRVVLKYGRDLGKLLLDCLLVVFILKNRNAALEVVSEEVEAISGAETHVRQVIDRLHAIT